MKLLTELQKEKVRSIVRTKTIAYYHPKNFHIENFQENKIAIVPNYKDTRGYYYIFGNGKWSLYKNGEPINYPEESIVSYSGLYNLDITDYYSISIELHSKEPSLSYRLMKTLEYILKNIEEMDCAGLTTKYEFNSEEYLNPIGHLFSIDIFDFDNEITFNYVNNKVNATWEAYFIEDGKGNWKFSGYG